MTIVGYHVTPSDFNQVKKLKGCHMSEEYDLASLNAAQQVVDARVLQRRGYWVVIAGFMCNFIVFGISFTYGVFQEYYLSAEGPLHDASISAVTLIGTLSTGLTYLLGILNPTLNAYFRVRSIMMAGALIMSTGLICAGWCSQVWQFALTQGILFGAGSSLVYIPPVTCAPAYFGVNRGTAMGILFSGTGVGGLAMAPFSRYLISAVSWQWAVRILGCVSLACSLAATAMVTPHPSFVQAHGRHGIELVNLSVAKTAKFVLQTSGSMLQSAGYLIPLFYMSAYAQTLGFTASQGALFIGINNAVNAIFKVVLGHYADVHW